VDRKLTKRAQRQALLAAIARREWLLQILALGAAGCGRDRAQAGESTLTISYPAGEWPVLFTDSASQLLVFLPLVKRNAKGEIEGRLARNWEHSPDYRTWTVHLRTDVKWEDGRPVTAQDVKFTLDLFAHPDVLLVAPGAFSMTVLDDSTYRITYHTREHAAAGAPVASPFDDFTVFYPKHLLENLDPKTFRTWEFWSRPVGNGPYRYVRYVPQTMMEFEANPDYYRGKPKIERVVLKFLPAAGSPLTELLSGNVQVLFYARSQDLLKVRSDPRFLAYYSILPDILSTIAWNHRHPLFRDAAVRRALTLAINRRELYQVLSLPEEIPILDMPAERYVRRGEFPDPLPHDPAQAKRLLDEAGWREVNGDGIREREGQPYRFVALVQGNLEPAAVYVQAELRRMGIDLQIQTMDRALVQRRIRAGEFEAAMLPVNFGPRNLLAWFGAGSLLGYTNGRVTPLLSRAENTLDPDEIDRIYRELMLIFQADVPVTFLSPNVETMVVARHVRGLSSPNRSDPVWYMEDLWIEK